MASQTKFKKRLKLFQLSRNYDQSRRWEQSKFTNCLNLVTCTLYLKGHKCDLYKVTKEYSRNNKFVIYMTIEKNDINTL